MPGLGAGYLYQRRWKAYWITSALATNWFALGAVLGQDAEAAVELKNQLIGLGGLASLSAGTAIEAGLAVKKACLGTEFAVYPASHRAKGGMGAFRSMPARRRASDIPPSFGGSNVMTGASEIPACQSTCKPNRSARTHKAC